jgi:glutaredoxin
MKLNKFFVFMLIGFFLFSFVSPKIIEPSTFEEKITIHFFEQRGCPDCGRQKEFLEKTIKEEYPHIEIKEYSIAKAENQEKLHQMMDERKIKDYKLVVPTTFIGENYFQGFYEEDKELIIKAIKGENIQRELENIRGKQIIRIPFIGEVELGNWSLPVLAFVIGNLDGLNVCSIGALILILMIVLVFDSRKKIFFYGGLFIVTAVLIYGTLVFAWTTLFDLLSSVIGPINFFIGIAALFGGAYFLNQFIKFYKYGPSCEYNENKFVVKATKRVKQAFGNEKNQTIFLVTSVIIFAAIITLVELPCSFGLPMVYGGILANSELSFGGYLFYIGLYLFFYMLIEIIIFIGAVITKEVWFAESKMITWIYFAGTIVLFFLAYYYLIGF